MTTTPPELAAVRKTATVPQDCNGAFRLFTEEFGAWWPLATHSVGESDATGVVFGAGVGEEIVETIADGRTTVWGTVTNWAPPHRVRFTWHPGTPPNEATTVEVTFEAIAAGTRVTLTHTGWENRPDGARARAGYDPGWDLVVGRYVERAGD